ncbi:hemerythrin-like metal-binding domain-containing protein [Halobacteroides halobius DSM 5150]|uniref:Hemerythrin-like metal-binding domain-containing protein n=1 Tax=Halobacteroides halobius (strain ATCC 35273 / DSM 5150 / MD-1) TaxID=748449 RepID=L0KCE7_HALHC|nr:hemerythrin family protein [Halobacteroides halobius]AGB42225.1 hemerythrin-like metal-binding domain-containing protein [Halobacteroides halobius DSM 5150]
MTVNWNQGLELGIKKIDQQHRAFFEERDKFVTACTQLLKKERDSEINREKIAEVFYFLTDYFKTHFSDEEQLLQEKEYSYYEEHKQRHQKFIKEVQQIKYEFLQTDEINIELVHQLKDKITNWFVNHIAKEDKKIANHL